MCRKTSRQGRRPAWLNRDLWLDLKNKRRIYDLWKRGQVSHEDYKDVVKLCRESIRRAKAQLELNLATAVMDNKKYFYKFVNSKRRIRENLPPLLDAEGNMVTKDEEKAEVLNVYFASLAVELAVPWTPSLMRWEMGRESRLRSAQLKRRWSETCYTTWMHTSLWDRMGYTQGC